MVFKRAGSYFDRLFVLFCPSPDLRGRTLPRVAAQILFLGWRAVLCQMFYSASSWLTMRLEAVLVLFNLERFRQIAMSGLNLAPGKKRWNDGCPNRALDHSIRSLSAWPSFRRGDYLLTCLHLNSRYSRFPA
jgi:hypothetical protein